MKKILFVFTLLICLSPVLNAQKIIGPSEIKENSWGDYGYPGGGMPGDRITWGTLGGNLTLSGEGRNVRATPRSGTAGRTEILTVYLNGRPVDAISIRIVAATGTLYTENEYFDLEGIE